MTITSTDYFHSAITSSVGSSSCRFRSHCRFLPFAQPKVLLLFSRYRRKSFPHAILLKSHHYLITGENICSNHTANIKVQPRAVQSLTTHTHQSSTGNNNSQTIQTMSTSSDTPYTELEQFNFTGGLPSSADLAPSVIFIIVVSTLEKKRTVRG